MSEVKTEYAKALFDIACENDCVGEYADILTQIKQIILDNPGYTEFLYSPAIPQDVRLEAIDEAFGTNAPTHIVSFLKLLCENGKILLLEECIDEFISLQRQLTHIINVRVISAIALDERQKEKLGKQLEKKYQVKVCADYFVDESIIGGMKIEIGDDIIDGSVGKRIQRMKEVMSI